MHIELDKPAMLIRIQLLLAWCCLAWTTFALEVQHTVVQCVVAYSILHCIHMHLGCVADCLASARHSPSQAVHVSNAQQSLTTSQAIDIAGSDIDPAFAMQANTLQWFVLFHNSVKHAGCGATASCPDKADWGQPLAMEP